MSSNNRGGRGGFRGENRGRGGGYRGRGKGGRGRGGGGGPVTKTEVEESAEVRAPSPVPDIPDNNANRQDDWNLPSDDWGVPDATWDAPPASSVEAEHYAAEEGAEHGTQATNGGAVGGTRGRGGGGRGQQRAQRARGRGGRPVNTDNGVRVEDIPNPTADTSTPWPVWTEFKKRGRGRGAYRGHDRGDRSMNGDHTNQTLANERNVSGEDGANNLWTSPSAGHNTSTQSISGPVDFNGRGRGTRGRGGWPSWADGRGRGRGFSGDHGERGRGRGRGATPTPSNNPSSNHVWVAQNSDGGADRNHNWRGRGRGQRGERGFSGERGRGRGERGGWGGRGGRGFLGGRGASFAVEDDLPPERDIRESLLVPAITQLVVPEVEADTKVVIEHFKCLSSYSWAKDPNPTILVPGAPRQWLDYPLPITVSPDNEIRMFHEDAFHMGGESTLLPLFRAVDTLLSDPTPESSIVETAGSAIDWTTVDFVTDRNNLRKLLRWVREPYPPQSPQHVVDTLAATSPISPTSPSLYGEVTSPSSESASVAVAEWDPRKDFRIDMQLGGEKTVLMHRWAPRVRERVIPPKGGCRTNFERESTAAAPGCEQGEGHYRIVQYNIGGFNMVVRFEVDGYVPSTSRGPAAASVEQDEMTPEPGLPTHEAKNSDDAPKAEPANDVVAQPLAGSTCLSEHHHVNTFGSSITAEAMNGENADLWNVPIPASTEWGSAEATTPAQGVADSGVPQNDSSVWEVDNDPAAWEVKDDPSAWGANETTSAISEWNANVTPEFTQTSAFVPIADFKVVRAGTLLPHSQIIELATRSAFYLDRISPDDTYLQMFLTQTPTHLVAVHQRGTFERVIRQELESPQFTDIAEKEDIQTSLVRFVAVLREVQRLAVQHGQLGRVSLVCEKGQLEMFGRVGEDGLVRPGELERFISTASNP